MQQGQRGSFQLMKSLNRSIILNKIRVDGPISRADIAKETTLTPPTVSNMVKELLSSKMVVEIRQGESSGGRKPTLLTINSEGSYLIGLDIGPKYLRCISTDLMGNILSSSIEPIPFPITNERLLEVVKHQVGVIIDFHKGDSRKLIGIGIGMHGVVNVNLGEALYAPSLQLRNIPLKKELEATFNTIVFVENDARVMALGEMWFGNGTTSNHSITINIGRGIGAGIIINGKLFHGEHFIAGEIGHMTIDISGGKCSCGNYGCLESVAAGPAIAERVKRELSLGKKSIITDLINNDLDRIDGRLVFEAAQKGDQLCEEILQQTGRYLGIGLTNLIHIINPQQIVLAGGVSKAGDFIINSLIETIEQRVLTLDAKKTEIRVSKFEDYATAIGAITLILEHLFSPSSTIGS
ncbi:ROK family transcriptional regulator [Litchfieldia salsa]|uniref:ROK family protein (Putative glucokinase) n=1 Tax=Litchfieldia salsa TaxID=930152 RepID=A0A1H0WQN2_9BACI|nr:ROK family transcriptional regulator [Litchfieldia salsa]SDP93023.1 ROK family protein (putative glucokinase) [Litchfieldia salsa]